MNARVVISKEERPRLEYSENVKKIRIGQVCPCGKGLVFIKILKPKGRR